MRRNLRTSQEVAALAQLGERETEVLKVLCSIHRSSTLFLVFFCVVHACAERCVIKSAFHNSMANHIYIYITNRKTVLS